jgi:DNA processing protein
MITIAVASQSDAEIILLTVRSTIMPTFKTDETSMPLAWIALNSVTGLGPVKISALLEKFGSAEAAFKQLPPTVPAAGGEGNSVNKATLLKRAEDQLERAHRLDVRILTLSDPDYPMHLKEIYAPPPVLFVRGDCSVFKKHAIAVVGTRRNTTYGKSATIALVKELVRKHLVVVSGLAHGIDTIAHQTCLDNNGKTVAVLGCGIDRYYPRDNKVLMETIASTGAVVSEFPLGTEPETYNFPRRNRIISGCCAGVLVIEAPERSGSLITANFALQQGRDVFAVPGSIFSASSTGTFNLIKDGAIPVRSAGDIIDSIQCISHAELIGKGTTPSSPQGVMKMPLDLLNVSERALLDICSETPARIDVLAQKTGKSVSELFDILLSLELKGLIKQVSGQQYLRV